MSDHADLNAVSVALLAAVGIDVHEWQQDGKHITSVAYEHESGGIPRMTIDVKVIRQMDPSHTHPWGTLEMEPQRWELTPLAAESATAEDEADAFGELGQ